VAGRPRAHEPRRGRTPAVTGPRRRDMSHVGSLSEGGHPVDAATGNRAVVSRARPACVLLRWPAWTAADAPAAPSPAPASPAGERKSSIRVSFWQIFSDSSVAERHRRRSRVREADPHGHAAERAFRPLSLYVDDVAPRSRRGGVPCEVRDRAGWPSRSARGHVHVDAQRSRRSVLGVPIGGGPPGLVGWAGELGGGRDRGPCPDGGRRRRRGHITIHGCVVHP
jgi:hypothetical protein